MIPKKHFCFVFSLFFIAVSAFMLFPNDSYAQAGCCITNGGQCSPGCGPQGTSCQRDSEGPQCAIFIEGESCYQVENNVGECQPIGCCLVDEFECTQTTPGTCAFNGGGYLGDGDCLPQFMDQCTPPPVMGCCETDGPPACNVTTAAECQGQFTAGAMCATPTSCGDTPPPIDGCCQVTDNSCDDRQNVECLNAPFFPGGMCMDGPGGTFCEPPPVGCCVFGDEDCDITSEELCEGDFGKYQGDGTTCVDIPECNMPPEGCCVLPENPGLSVSNLLDMILDNCVIETESACNAQDGVYQGDGVSCDQVPQCFPSPARSIPTLGQWGLIAVAGLLGVYSLIVMRRKNYNVG